MLDSLTKKIFYGVTSQSHVSSRFGTNDVPARLNSEGYFDVADGKPLAVYGAKTDTPILHCGM
ncbi:Uncharacterized protein APZ42_023777 [Daphnia magna]|uniref:Uncharacterized protein n=1 Tax=Daphnia magna TaxID=35525 RepID=A0A164U4C9_9CRUS|nr:Uncharacterized protein APZ42_023777 [Daphnia magna]